MTDQANVKLVVEQLNFHSDRLRYIDQLIDEGRLPAAKGQAWEAHLACEEIIYLLAPVAAGTHRIIGIPPGYSYQLVKLDEPGVASIKAAGGEP